ncbi:UvrD-helicase domain-containing protein [Loigolactobacillus coryniformis]|uniref:UvrD-helicase domain-containing protein n=1 Tax=Loigolactobacillus coryniformis TaxID=1610 RepID=UPI001C5D0C71|nr:UvrD-helicase domain-containing protein [Loigolactobacillus coryniformis]MBW4802109.1 AAA family ATPase [Loigolactobacillus coryniformis subsp. torquens]MBW4806388.1 AAA family ATPase [Loigolactobacillus coryniformis subsp. torquens]
MKLVNSGAGSGKTTSLADIIIEREAESSSKSHVFVIAYSNYAADVIKTRLTSAMTADIQNIHFSTIHSFLWNYIIEPYYFLLFGIQFISVSNSKLSSDNKLRASKLKQMRTDGILHVSEFARISKQVVKGRKAATKHEKSMRSVILDHLSNLIGAIYVDEAQDMDQDTADILEVLNNTGIFCYLMGDVNQDLHARNGFRSLIENNQQNITLNKENHRCPQLHVELSNRYLPYEQVSTSEVKGKLGYVLEKDCNLQQIMEEFSDGLVYISKSIRSFKVHKSTNIEVFEQLEYILRKYHVIVPTYSDINSQASKKWAFDVAHLVLEAIRSRVSIRDIVNRLIKKLQQTYSPKLYAQLINSVKEIDSQGNNANGFPVLSIEGVKGNQANNCLLIMSTDLFRVLIGEHKKANSTTNLLYVGLTRSTNKLLIMLTKEVSEHYSEKEIKNKLEALGIKVWPHLFVNEVNIK